MSYTMEGIVAAAPDFGIVPAGILAIFVFQYFPAHRVRTRCLSKSICLNPKISRWKRPSFTRVR